MHRIDTKTAQKDKFGAGRTGFTRGKPPDRHRLPPILDDDYFDMLQEELCESVVEASGASPRRGGYDQLLTALRALLLKPQESVWRYQIGWHGENSLENLGLGEGSALPVECACSVAFSHSANRMAEMQRGVFSAEEYLNWQTNLLNK